MKSNPKYPLQFISLQRPQVSCSRWFNGCGLANLNGRNLGEGREGYEGILWYFYGKDNRSFRASKMAVSKK